MNIASQMAIVLGLALLTLRVLENRVGILTGDGCGDGLSMLKLLEMLSSGFDGDGLGKIGRWCGKLAASWRASAASRRDVKVGLLGLIRYPCTPLVMDYYYLPRYLGTYPSAYLPWWLGI